VSATLAQSSWDRRHGVGRSGGENATAVSTEFTDAEIEIIKNKWRDTHPRIKSLWYALKNAIERAVQNKKPDKPERVRVGCPIEIWCDDAPALYIKLPSGRVLTYPKARYTYMAGGLRGVVSQGEEGDQEGVVFMDNASGAWRLTRMYGGLATENIVQAIARDLLAEAMLRIDAAGYKIITHVHDECVIEVPIKDAERVKPIFTELMMQSPSWAEGLPIVVNSWVNKRYTK
jgi:DNA polymerase